MASSSTGPSMSTLAAPPFTQQAPPSPLMQQHARTTRKPLRSSPLAGPVLSRSPSQSHIQEFKESTPPEFNEAERMIALNVHGALDSPDTLRPAFLVPPRPAYIRGSHSRSLQEIERLRPRPVSLYSSPTLGENTLRNHRRSFMGLDAERARDAEEYALWQRNHGLPALGEAEDQVHDQAHEDSEEEWGPGQAEVEAKYNSDRNSLSMKLKNPALRTDVKSLSTQARPKSILLNVAPSSSLSQSLYSFSPTPSSSLYASSTPPGSPKSTSTSLPLYSTSPRSSSGFLSLPPTSPSGDAVWLTQNTYNETPKFTRLGLGAPGVVMPVSAKTKAHNKPFKTQPTAAPTASNNALPESPVRVPGASPTLNKRNSFMATISASFTRQRSLSLSHSLSQIAEHGQQQAGHARHISPSATQVSVPSGNNKSINSAYDTPRVSVDADDETKPLPAGGSSPHTTAIAAPVQAPSGTAPPKSTESTSSLSLASSNSRSQSQASSQISSPTCSSLPSSPTPSLTRSSSASSSTSSLPIHTPPSEAEGFPIAPLSRLKEEVAPVEEGTPRLSSEAPAITITDADVAFALENAHRADVVNNNLANSRRRSRLGLRLGCSLECVKSWTTASSPAKNGDIVPRSGDITASRTASTSTSIPTPAATGPALPHAPSSKSRAAGDVAEAFSVPSPRSAVAATLPLISAPCASPTLMETAPQSISSTNAPPPLVPAGEAPSPSSVTGLENSTRRKKLMPPFSQALVEESESSGDEEESLNDGNLDRCGAQHGDGKTSEEVLEACRTDTGDYVQQEDSCHVRTRTWSSHNLLRLVSPSSEQEKLSPIPRSQSETAIPAQPSQAILIGNVTRAKKAGPEKGGKGHGRRGSVRRMWDALMHRDSSKRQWLS